MQRSVTIPTLRVRAKFLAVVGVENDVLRILDDAIEVAKLLGITSVVIDRSLYSWPS